MRLRVRHKSLLAGAAAAVAVVVLPAEVMAAHRDDPFEVVATIAACKRESLTIAAQVTPSGNVPPVLRKASLKLRFVAAPLYGRTRRSREFDLGRTMNARRSARFADLPAQGYGGIVRYRWVRGKRTVASGFVRTRKARVAGRRGKAFCSLRVGRPPTDTQAPFILPVPYDSRWYRGPLTVNFFVVDDLSGVALVVSRVDGGPFVRGRRTTITGEGSHLLEYAARDAAGNSTPVGAVTLRVDENPPTTPAVSAPSGTTTDSTPDIQWSASSDSASGVAGYVVLVRDSGGAIVWSQFVAASVTTATVGQALAPGDYTAEVIAYDGAAPLPFTATGTRAFTVVPPPDDTDDDDDGVPDTSDNCPSAANPDQANLDGDAQGDVCDLDDDNDGRNDTSDNCPTIANSDQANFDGDAQGDACDGDDDNDGLADPQDPNDNNVNSDGDSKNDGADACPAQHHGPVDANNDGCPDV